ncbi:hypothetical protein [Frateuria terrea]|uniref:Uncharacterized protein n=1 Tax=Frateuria terrea TaxID=529704 RepID=A0A1H6ZPD0_9GAMM|nr:hypothetical protein [Frateuria terrea]SEJ55231.1 hypothetical protein SAMN04487997_0189 [Frateuria terrea]SFP47331.1 hypothetical protein SAMN02927913_2201 [Frateuria terrea]
MTLSFFSGRKRTARTHPQLQPVTVPVNVTVTEREAKQEGVDWAAPDAETVAHIGAHLPNRPVSANLRAARFAAVLDRQAAFLADRTGTVEPPERWEVVDACRFAAEHIRDGVVIA